MELDPIGEMTDEELEQRTETVTIPFVTYHYKTHKKKTTKVEFRREAPMGADVAVMKGLAGQGVDADTILAYLERSMTEAGRKSWDALMDDSDHMVKADSLLLAYNALVRAHTSPFPTGRPAGSPRTTASTNKTSRPAAKRAPVRREALKR